MCLAERFISVLLEYCTYVTNKYALNMSAVVRVYSLSIDKREKNNHLTQDFFFEATASCDGSSIIPRLMHASLGTRL